MSFVKGVGTDLVSIERIESLWLRFGYKFAQRILSAKELCLFETKACKVSFIAKRFAAKEAITKAIGTGIGEAISFHDISILNQASGQPFVEYSEKGSIVLHEKSLTVTHISISDEKAYALAFAVVS